MLEFVLDAYLLDVTLTSLVPRLLEGRRLFAGGPFPIAIAFGIFIV